MYRYRTIPYIAGIFCGWKFSRISRFRSNSWKFQRRKFCWVPRRHYQWACHCRFLQFTKVLIAKIWLSAVCESFHPRKIPAIRYISYHPNAMNIIYMYIYIYIFIYLLSILIPEFLVCVCNFWDLGNGTTFVVQHFCATKVASCRTKNQRMPPSPWSNHGQQFIESGLIHT